MILEAIGYAADAIEMSMGRAYDSLLSVQARSTDGLFKPSHKETVGIFSDCWSTVDQFYALTKLLSKLDELKSREHVARFLTLSRTISDLRNHMDHLSSNLTSPNSKLFASTNMPPLFGALTFTWLHEQLFTAAGRYRRHVMWYLPASGHHTQTTLSVEQNTDPPHFSPIDNVFLHAWKFKLNLSETTSFALEAAREASNFAESAVAGLTAEQGLQVEDLRLVRAYSNLSCRVTRSQEADVQFRSFNEGTFTAVN